MRPGLDDSTREVHLRADFLLIAYSQDEPKRSDIMKGNPIGWFEIYVQDMVRARAFYESVLDVSLESLNAENPELWKFPQSFDNYGSSGALARVEGMPSGNNSTLVYFSCEDCGVEAARVPDAGGRIMKEKFSIGEYGFVALAIDPDGNLFGLHSME
jgi:predicted enzyme related to lactoylglutathione lyase